VDVDRDAKNVTGDDGSVTPYDVLLLATGSSAFMPPIQGLDKDGVFVFRTLDDTRGLLERVGRGQEGDRDRRRPARARGRARDCRCRGAT
jgi:nitrite reductase (NADH) large subunit